MGSTLNGLTTIPPEVAGKRMTAISAGGTFALALDTTGCGHAGIINVVRHAQRLTGETRIAAVIGGFHLSGPMFEPIIEPTVAAFDDLQPGLLMPAHCTGWKAVHRLARRFPDAFVQSAVGTTSRSDRGCLARPRLLDLSRLIARAARARPRRAPGPLRQTRRPRAARRARSRPSRRRQAV